MTGAFGQAAGTFACTSSSSTHGGFLHWTETVSSLRSPTWSQSFVATATMVQGTAWPTVQAGMTVDFEYSCVAPGWTTPLNTCSPLTVTTMVSASSEQFRTV